MGIERIITLVVSILGIIAAVDSAVQRYNKATTSKYAAQRDFEHLRRNQEQLKQSITVLMNENDSLREDVIKMRTQLETFITLTKE